MGMYKYIRDIWKSPAQNSETIKSRLIEWRDEPSTIRIERPTRLDRARSLGYRAKPGVIMVRQRVARGGRTKEIHRKGRKPKRFGRIKVIGKSYQWVAEERAAKKFPNCEVYNSYLVLQDGKHAWYEIILLDRGHPAIQNDRVYAGIISQKGRAERGLT
ncbi:50S ribosomal protein L15e [Candidatus Woesearchaeota archaeon]|nr:50S ribosomal protein L15e [Candidatus Woesearchaeota archaeon]